MHKKNTEVRASKTGDSTFTKDMKTGETVIDRRLANGEWKSYFPKKKERS